MNERVGSGANALAVEGTVSMCKAGYATQMAVLHDRRKSPCFADLLCLSKMLTSKSMSRSNLDWLHTTETVKPLPRASLA